MASKEPLLAYWIRRFLVEHVVERNLSRHTQASYRDTLALLMPFVAAQARTPIDALSVPQLSAGRVRAFLTHLEEQRRCGVATRNTRLAALHAFARFVGQRRPEQLAWAGDIRAVPFKKSPRPAMTYLDKPEMDALLNTPDRATTQGARDYALLLFLYNTGARADEAARLTVAQVNFLGAIASVRLVGKGGKDRVCPLWALTATLLKALTAGRAPDDVVFLNRRQQPTTRFGIHHLVRRTCRHAVQTVPALSAKRISPHTLRHTTAVHLLRAGTDINTIRAWLGHVSLDTTNVYAHVDLDLKAKALAHCEIMTPTRKRRRWRDDPRLMAFLRSL